MARHIKAFLLISSFAIAGTASAAASLSLSPPSGTFVVGETFSVSIYMDTGGQFVNAVQADLTFPPDKLQVVSPSTGRSFIDVWVGQPNYSNSEGTLSFRGAIPNPGINTSQGLVSTITFRIKSPGSAIIKFIDTSKVLLNDGRGTDVLAQKVSGIYTLTLPPPAGPIVISTTHPDQTRWYNSSSLILKWTNEFPAQGYSYVLNDEPISSPDDTPEENMDGVSYNSLSDGTHYFHIKALKDGVWGSPTHFAANIDTSPPAKFDVKISPAAITSNREPMVGFSTTDALSGLNHYELKLVPLSHPVTEDDKKPIQEFFIEVVSPYIPKLDFGKYDVIVRAYDNAGNFQEISKRLNVVSNIVVGFTNAFWPWLIILLILAALSAYLAWWRIKRWRQHIENYHQTGILSHDKVQKKLEQLKQYQTKYGHLVLVLALMMGFIFSSSVFASSADVALSPPVITTVSHNISNQDVFYVGGKVANLNSEVIIYLQNLTTGETISQVIKPDKKGDWFYSHNSFLSDGQYLLWAQGKNGEVVSPPSPQEAMVVSKSAFQLGASRISYETVYLFFMVILALVVIAFAILSTISYRHGKKRKEILLKELGEAEESIRRGFAVLKRDIERELKGVSEERHREELLRDLEVVKAHIGKEVWDINLGV